MGQNGWSLERRAQQAKAIQGWQPWKKSTGPRTPEGKARSARNADKGKCWKQMRELFKLLNQELRKQKEVLGKIGRSFQKKTS